MQIKIGLVVLFTAVIITIGPSPSKLSMARLALSVNLTVAEYRRVQLRNLPVPEAFGVLVSVDALRNPISVERLQGPIVMITAATSQKKHFIYS